MVVTALGHCSRADVDMILVVVPSTLVYHVLYIRSEKGAVCVGG